MVNQERFLFCDIIIIIIELNQEKEFHDVNLFGMLNGKFNQTCLERIDLNEQIYNHMDKLLAMALLKFVHVQVGSFPDNDNSLVFLKLLPINGKLLECASERIRNDLTFILLAVKSDVDALEYVSKELRDQRDFALTVIEIPLSTHRSTLKYLPKFKDDYEIVLKAVRQCGRSYEHASESLKLDKEIIETAVKSNGMALFYVPKKLIDRNLVLSAISSPQFSLAYAKDFNNDREIVWLSFQLDPNPNCLSYASDALKSDREFCLKLVNLKAQSIQHLSDELKNDIEIGTIVVKSDPTTFTYLSDALKNNREIASIAVKGNATMISHASKELQNDRDFIMSSISSGKQVVDFIQDARIPLSYDKDFIYELINSNCNYDGILTEPIKGFGDLIDPSLTTCFALWDNINDKKVLMKAIPFNSDLLEELSDDLKNDRELIELAIKVHDDALKFASQELRADKQLVLEAIEYNAFNFEYASEELRDDRQVVECAILKSGWLFEFASENLRNDKDLCTIATQNSEYSLLFSIGDDLKRDRDIVLDNVKKYEAIIPETFKDDREIILEAVKFHGSLIEQASFGLRNHDRDLVLTAVRNGCSLNILDRRIVDTDLLKESIFNYYPYEIDIEHRDDEKIAYFYILMGYSHFGANFSPRLLSDKNFIGKCVKFTGSILEYVSEELKNDREIVKQSVSIDGRSLRFASESLRNDREIVEIAVKQNGVAFEYVSDVLSKDREIVLLASETGLYFYTEFNNDKEIALKSVSYDASTLQKFSYDIRNDRQVVLEAMKNDFNQAFKYSIYDFRMDKDFIHEAEIPLSQVVPNLRNDREFVLKSLVRALEKQITQYQLIEGNEMVEEYVGSQIMYISDELKEEFSSNKEILLQCIGVGPIAFLYASEELQNDEEFVLQAVQRNGKVLRYVPIRFKHSRTIALEAVRNCGISLIDVSNELRKDREIVSNAVSNCVKAFDYASHELKNDKEFVFEMISKNYRALYFASIELQNDEQIMSHAMDFNIEALNCASYSLRNNVEFLKRMNKNNRLVEEGSFKLQISINMRALLGIEETDSNKYEKLLDFFINKLEIMNHLI